MQAKLVRLGLGAAVAIALTTASPAHAAPEAGPRVADVAREAGTQLQTVFTRLDRNGDGLLQPKEAPLYARDGRPLSFEAFLEALDAPPPTPCERARLQARNPVLILPGFLMPEWCYETLQKRLARAGYTEVTVLRGWPWVRSIAAYATEAKLEAERLRARTGARQVDLVAHSMGGLVARTMIQDLGYEDRVDHLVTFGTPHHGTQIGPLASWYAASAGEMTPGSAFLEALNRQEGRPSAVKTTSIRAQFDEIVFPHESVVLEGAVNLEIRRAGHILIIYMPELAAAVIEALAD